MNLLKGIVASLVFFFVLFSFVMLLGFAVVANGAERSCLHQAPQASIIQLEIPPRR